MILNQCTTPMIVNRVKIPLTQTHRNTLALYRDDSPWGLVHNEIHCIGQTVGWKLMGPSENAEATDAATTDADEYADPSPRKLRDKATPKRKKKSVLRLPHLFVN